ncbi:hypothetical protein [Leptospira stimsonii]|uniref:Uncharacterized protein n=1 Tax=Leptospira stimsonii TaxID=2202203 RepID=A0A4R9L1X9_9LEPT|nr:hypothetical protein [Leptospira stimsonii]RHX88249.1 hypothetical protein DLM78_04660 [Leptospira stimsonii]TGK26384.1 hypothetical protein EHO98_00580 [Leptospira stimsonii]TGM10717.1 hypothetical protein EHQ90_17975 [Leptospira stimsonii]
MIVRISFFILALFSLTCSSAQTQEPDNHNKIEKIQTAKTFVVESFSVDTVREICSKTPDPEFLNPEDDLCMRKIQEELFGRIYLPSPKEKNITKALELVLALKKVFPKKKMLIGKDAEIHVRHVQQRVEYCDPSQTTCVPVIHNLISFSNSNVHDANHTYTLIPQMSYLEKDDKSLPVAKWNERLDLISKENIEFMLNACFNLE